MDPEQVNKAGFPICQETPSVPSVELRMTENDSAPSTQRLGKETAMKEQSIVLCRRVQGTRPACGSAKSPPSWSLPRPLSSDH